MVSILSFVCSIGNVPLAGVLWNGGISFGGVISFIFADLLIIPILVIYRKYYGTKMTLFIAGTFYVTMVAAGYMVEFLFGGLGLIPTTAKRQGGGGIHYLELHHHPQHRLSGLSCRAALSVRNHRRDTDAKDDGRQTRTSPRPRPSQPRSPRPPRNPALISPRTLRLGSPKNKGNQSVSVDPPRLRWAPSQA